MKLDLSEIARIPGSYAEHDIDMTFKDIEGVTLLAPVRGKLIMSSTGNVLILEGGVDADVELACVRCGKPYCQPVHAEFQEDFVVRQPQTRGQALRIEEEDEAPETRLFLPDSLDLNLDELLRQSILVSLPLKPLCAEDCPGLCAQCGQSLADEGCICERPETVNPRMAVLKQLLDKQQK